MENHGTKTVITNFDFLKCSFCKNKAKYDGKTSYGPWGYMCQTCFDIYGTGLGIGKGQELILKDGNNGSNKRSKCFYAKGDR